ncbi:lipopolysaccharide biosynthesis protein [uncultured Bacteroides sp.]|uniref:lipopolysaccharide biosynthesis protein n=1 Tax=uncultured Bacteroides sp. TaxID=162156 RepID=UPI002AA91FD6|nr:lipopolysaccharide biosynthesis protein [uncultured Bacteroides sp.]
MQSTKNILFSGVFYTAVARYSGIVISLIVTAVLSRMLSPDDFGVVAIATVIISFFSIFTDMGISPAIIQNKNLTEHDLSDLFSFTAWAGCGISMLFFLASWPIAAWYGTPILRTLCQFLAIDLFFSSANIVPNALFHKNKEFKFIAWRSFIIQIAGGTLAVGVALAGGGLYALIINPILSSALLFAISIRKYPQKARWTWGLGALRKIFSYSAYQFLFNVINYFSRNLDKLFIGKYMGMTPLGYYEKSYRLMMLPLQNITYVITPVMHPVLSDFQKDINKLSSSYERIVHLLAFMGIPLSVFLFFNAEEITLIIFGNQWMPSVPIFRILSLSVGVQIILSSSGSIFQASGDTRSLFVCGLFSSILNVTGMLIGIFVFGTLEAVATCICITFTTNFLQCYWQMYHVTFKQRNLIRFAKQLISPLIVSGILVIILLLVTNIFSDMNIFLNLALKAILFIIIFGCYIQFTNEYDLIGKVKKLIKR